MQSSSRLVWVLFCVLGQTACAAAGASDQGSDASTGGGQDHDAASGGNTDVSSGGGGGDAASTQVDAASGGGADSSTGGGDGGDGGPVAYALPAPKQCDNQNYVMGCQQGVASSPCGGICSGANACENISQKPGADIGFACPRFMLFADEMLQAAKDDWNSDTPPFSYAVAGHDPDTSGIDPNGSTCCQCYELVFNTPSPSNDNEGCVNADCTKGSAVPVPPPLVVQVFNLGATTQTFDLFMGAGGFGGNDACAPVGGSTSPSGKYLYTAFPAAGESNGGGVKVSLQDPPWPADCKTNLNYVTTATLSSTACQGQVAAACGQIAAPSQSLTATTIRSCEQANAPASFYHFNWAVYAKKVECPSHLTEVTGCKLSPQGLPSVQPGVTAAQAAADSSWRVYGTTTMQDCCKPACAWQDNVRVSGANLSSVGLYNSFYTCDQSGVPVTE
jgi:hypothetical protein